MYVSAINNANLSFGRALTKKEEKDLLKLESKAKKELDTGTTSATVFDFFIPKKEHDTGIGTTFSKDAQDMAVFLKTMFGINAIQLQPQGQISNFVHSPYSGTSFSLGAHIIDLNKLQDEDYEYILKPKDFSTPYTNSDIQKDKADYNRVFDKDGQKAMLKKAYDNFIKLDKTSELKQEFETFKEENSYWLERDALFEAAAVDNGTEDVNKWPARDKNVFATDKGDTKRIEELKEVKDERKRNVVDFEEFVQFIADKQQKESKKEFNDKGIDVYGDCQIGFAQKDVWAHKSAFAEREAEFGCDLGGGKYTCWSPAINFDKLDGEAGELLYHKFNKAAQRYDGIRIDAAWQLIDPLLVYPLKDDNGNAVFDEKGNKLGYPIGNQPWAGRKIIKDIALKASDDNGIPREKIFLEILGGKEANDAIPYVKDLGTTLIHITKYAGDTWGRVKFYESNGGNNYQNMKPGQYIIGPGTHDDESLLTQFDIYGANRARTLANDMNLNHDELLHSREKWVDASFAELFTTKNQFATLPDLLGSSVRINHPDVQEGNWTYRAEPDYKEKYFENLTQGKGLNLPDALSKALKAKGKESDLTKKLDYYADILREPEDKGKKVNINL